jgi:hypothetical protein
MPSNAHSSSLSSADSQASGESPSTPPDKADQRMMELRGRISDLGFEMDAEKTGAAGMMGLGVFLFLLAALAAYDLLTGKAGVWASIGITRDTLSWIAYGLGAAAVLLVVLALRQRGRRDRVREAELVELQEEYARLLEQKNSASST